MFDLSHCSGVFQLPSAEYPIDVKTLSLSHLGAYYNKFFMCVRTKVYFLETFRTSGYSLHVHYELCAEPDTSLRYVRI